MGRSRGGLTTKVHAVVDAKRPAHYPEADRGPRLTTVAAPPDMLDTIGPGQTLLADRAYDSDALRQTLDQRGAWAQHQAHAQPQARSPAFSAFLYKDRNLGGALLQQAQALQGRRNPIRQARRKLPRWRQARLSTNLDAG